MADKVPQPIPGAVLVPRLLAYELAKWCEEEEMDALMIVAIDSDGHWCVRISDGVTIGDISFAGLMLQQKAMQVAADPDAPDQIECGEDEE